MTKLTKVFANPPIVIVAPEAKIRAPGTDEGGGWAPTASADEGYGGAPAKPTTGYHDEGARDEPALETVGI